MCFRPSQTLWLRETTYSDPAESSVGPATTTRPGNSSVFWNKSLRIATKARVAYRGRIFVKNTAGCCPKSPDDELAESVSEFIECPNCDFQYILYGICHQARLCSNTYIFSRIVKATIVIRTFRISGKQKVCPFFQMKQTWMNPVPSPNKQLDARPPFLVIFVLFNTTIIFSCHLRREQKRKNLNNVVSRKQTQEKFTYIRNSFCRSTVVLLVRHILITVRT